jgi:hypothetical protein
VERLRKALRWEVVPVISHFDPKYNDEPLWFERLYEPLRGALSSAAAAAGGADAEQD